MPPRPQLDNRIRRAEERFQAGRKLYLDGDAERARVEFDRAIDLLLSSPEKAPDRHLMEKKLDELVDQIHRYDLEGLGAADEQETAQFDKSPLKEILELTFPIDPSLKNKVRAQVQATTSQLPLEENDEVLRYINFFSSERGRRTLIGGLKRSGRYREMIRRILDEEGVPREMIFLSQAESGFLPRALSYKSAAGMWQFVKFRGNQYGLLQTSFTDDRLDPEKATRAGARHLHDLYQQFGDWYLAMAAYNCGPGCVSKAVERTGYADFWQLRSRNVLPRETANYVPLILAVTIMAKNPKDYGLEGIAPDPALEYDTVKLEANTNLPLLADLVERPVVELREMNPALLKNVAPAGYSLHVPKGASAVLKAGLSLVPAEKRASWRSHRVAEGESLASIARRYRTASNTIAAVNRAAASELRAGDLLIIPAAYAEPKPAARAASRPAGAVRGRTSAPRAGSVASARSAPAPRATGNAHVAVRMNRPKPGSAR
ncbi:MAG: transglycosylase SLT domain-containing protein [Acidobacteria bacterium]|nr:transglycosylase SLT domain-containing protein [Acidobacteriota bacterium]